MVWVIFNWDGCLVLWKYFRDVYFYVLGEGSMFLEDEKLILGFLKDVFYFFL